MSHMARSFSCSQNAKITSRRRDWVYNELDRYSSADYYHAGWFITDPLKIFFWLPPRSLQAKFEGGSEPAKSHILWLSEPLEDQNFEKKLNWPKIWAYFVLEPARLLGACKPGLRPRMDSTTGARTVWSLGDNGATNHHHHRRQCHQLQTALARVLDELGLKRKHF